MTPTETIELITVLASVIALMVAIINASTSAKSVTVTELKKLLEDTQIRVEKGEAKSDKLQNEIDELQKELQKERTLRMQYEDYIRKLLNQMRDASIIPAQMSDYVTKIQPFDK